MNKKIKNLKYLKKENPIDIIKLKFLATESTAKEKLEKLVTYPFSPIQKRPFKNPSYYATDRHHLIELTKKAKYWYLSVILINPMGAYLDNMAKRNLEMRLIGLLEY